MPAMTFEEFKEYATRNIMQYLPPEYANGEVAVYEVTKLGGSYTGLSVRTKERKTAVTVNLDQYYKEYQKFNMTGHIMRDMAQTIMTHSMKNDLEWITDYEQVRDKLFVRLSNSESNKAVLANAPHVMKEDLVMTCHVLVSKDDSVASTIVNDSLFKAYGITEEQLFADATENSQRLFPIKVQPLESFIYDMAAGEGYEHPINDKNHMLVVTNDMGINGASAMFYPKAMEKISDMIDDDYYIIPSSIHECLVIPESDHISYKHLESILHEVNAGMVAESEQLSSHVYHYDSAVQLFELADDYALRTRQSEYEFSTVYSM